jgi:hypothetical protein
MRHLIKRLHGFLITKGVVINKLVISPEDLAELAVVARVPLSKTRRDAQCVDEAILFFSALRAVTNRILKQSSPPLDALLGVVNRMHSSDVAEEVKATPAQQSIARHLVLLLAAVESLVCFYLSKSLSWTDRLRGMAKAGILFLTLFRIGSHPLAPPPPPPSSTHLCVLSPPSSLSCSDIHLNCAYRQVPFHPPVSLHPSAVDHPSRHVHGASRRDYP